MNTDFSVTKSMKLTERFNLQFRAEMFDLLNHPNLGNPVLTETSASFGKIQATRFPTGDFGSSRQAQFALEAAFLADSLFHEGGCGRPFFFGRLSRRGGGRCIKDRSCGRRRRVFRSVAGQFADDKLLQDVVGGVSANPDERVFKGHRHIAIALWIIEIRDAARRQASENGGVTGLPVAVVTLADHRVSQRVEHA